MINGKSTYSNGQCCKLYILLSIKFNLSFWLEVCWSWYLQCPNKSFYFYKCFLDKKTTNLNSSTLLHGFKFQS